MVVGNDNFIDGDNQSPVAPFRIVNIGNSSPVKLTEFIQAFEMLLDELLKRISPMQPGDVVST